MKFISLFVLLVLFFSFTEKSFSSPGGYTGRTLKTSTSGCGSCHSKATTITAYFTVPDTVITGQSYTVSITLVSSSGSGKYGVNIAAKIGTLAIISGQGLKLSSNELTQSSAITYVATKTIQFTYTAPASAGSDSLYGTVVRGYSGAWNWAPNKGMVVRTATGIINSDTPLNFSLSQNYPNPFNPTTNIKYSIAKSGLVKLIVIDALGQEVETIVNKVQSAGNYDVKFKAENLSSGIYFYKITSGDFTQVKKMFLIK